MLIWTLIDPLVASGLTLGMASDPRDLWMVGSPELDPGWPRTAGTSMFTSLFCRNHDDIPRQISGITENKTY